jgi:hypothetical protein
MATAGDEHFAARQQSSGVSAARAMKTAGKTPNPSPWIVEFCRVANPKQAEAACT